MRKAMICISFMLALLQFWPLVFGSRTVADVATPSARAAVVIDVPRPIKAIAVAAPIRTMDASYSNQTVPHSCFAQYREKFATCAKGDTACGGRINDQWDLCEATGFWPQ